MDSRFVKGALLLACAAGVQGQYFGGFGGFGGGYGFNTPSSSSNGYGFGPFRGGPGFNIDEANRIRTIHGVLAALAMVVLFPIGSILMRVLPGRLALWAHGLLQVVSYLIFVAAAGLGIYLVREVNIPFQGGNLVTNSVTRYHPIIGIVVLVALFFQPFLGLIHHARFKKLQRRQVWSYLHLYNGRIMITLGIVNGGLGLFLAGAPSGAKIAYGVVAGIIWVVWMAAAVFGECSRMRSRDKESRRSSPRSPRRTPRRTSSARRKLSDGERST